MKEPMEIYLRSKRHPEKIASLIQDGLDRNRTVIIQTKSSEAMSSVGEGLALLNKQCEFVKENSILKMVINP